jgi:hypothetical protein
MDADKDFICACVTIIVCVIVLSILAYNICALVLL